jgi:VWFA-related protein
VIVLLAGGVAAAQQPPAQQAPTFRTGTLVVPLDVRVTDRKGVPITDLTAADFTLTEDKVPQRITQFIHQIHEPEAPTSLSIGARFMDTAGAPPPRRRIFLIVMGRGRLQYPGKGADGAIHFVKNNLLPQDHVAVLAWDRATPFTTDHAKVVAVLERFKTQHEDVESRIQSQTGGLAGVYGSRDLPASVRGAVDSVFAGEAGALPESVNPNARAMADRERRTVDDLLSEAVGATREFVPGTTGGLGEFDDYVETTVQSMADLMSIYRGIDYLKYLDGEKHLLYISPNGFALPSVDDDKSLAAVAADARVVFNAIHTGGTSMSGSWGKTTSERLAELTGGYYTSLMYANQAADRLDGMTRSSYLLGYSPTNSAWDNKYRRVDVKVNRPGAVVHFRHGYFGREARPPMNAAAVLSLTRISAATRTGDVTDIELKKVTASPATGTNRERQVLVEFMLSGAQLLTGTEGTNRTAKFDLAVFIGDEQSLLIGQTWQTVELKLDAANYARIVRDGLPITLRVPIRRSSSYAKVIVYDYGADLLGSAQVKVRRK